MQRASVSERDFQTMMRIVAGQAERTDSSAPMPPGVLAGLAELIPCDALAFIMFDAATRQYFVDQDLDGFHPPSIRDTEPLDRAFWQHYWGSPACNHPDTSKDLTTITTLSDFHSDRALSSQAMYSDYFRPWGIQREMMVCLPSRPGRVLRLLLFRGPGPDFSPRDRDLLALLRPHLHQAYRQQRQITSSPLTPRQQQLLDLVTAGLTNRQIARRMSISEATVRKHLQHVFERLQVTNRTAAAIRAADDLTDAV